MATPHDDDAPPAPNDTVTAADLDLVDRLDREATPGPWHAADSISPKIVLYASPVREKETPDLLYLGVCYADGNGQGRRNMRFIATARTLLPRLARAYRDLDRIARARLGVIERRNEEIARLREEKAHAYARGRREAIEEAARRLEGAATAREADIDDECDGQDADRFCAEASLFRQAVAIVRGSK